MVTLSLDTRRFQNRRASACGYFFGAVVVHSNKFIKPVFSVIPDRALFFDDAKAILFKKTNQVCKLHSCVYPVTMVCEQATWLFFSGEPWPVPNLLSDYVTCET